MRDTDFKVWVRESGLLKEYRKARYEAFRSGGSVQDFIPFDDELENDLRKECNAIDSKRRRLAKRLLCMFVSSIKHNQSISFVTFTFKDSSLENLSLKTRREYLTRTLRVFDDYIANIDYGEMNGREHFHAVVLGDVDFEKWQNKLGFVKVQPIHVNDEYDIEVITQDNKNEKYDLADITRLKKYIVKLNNHATKDSVGADRLISKRGVKYPWYYYESYDQHMFRLLNKLSKAKKSDNHIEVLEIKAEIIRIQEGIYDYN